MIDPPVEALPTVANASVASSVASGNTEEDFVLVSPPSPVLVVVPVLVPVLVPIPVVVPVPVSTSATQPVIAEPEPSSVVANANASTNVRHPSASPLRLARPRSNPRTRTPMRYESPLNADAFRRQHISEEEEADLISSRSRMEGQRITIRPGAGRPVGAAIGMGRLNEDRSTPRGAPIRSRKQGPGRRKTRRYLNENFVNLAAELATTSAKGRKAAQVLIKAQQDAPKYRSIYNPDEHESPALTKFMNDEHMAGVRDKFFSGDLVETPRLSRSQKVELPCVTPGQMMNRIDSRLRRIVIKACSNSYPASKVVDTFETFLVRTHLGSNIKTSPEAWDGILLEPPTEKKNSNSMLVRFVFDPASSTGGFNRLLLSGVCEFHGLRTLASTSEMTVKGATTQARVLAVSGTLIGPDFKLVDQVMKRVAPVPSHKDIGLMTNKIKSIQV